MTTASEKELKGAWVIHHGRKLVLDLNGPAEFPAINEAAKAATLLTKLGQTDQATVTKVEARAIAVASGLDPRLELNGLLQVLERKRLIDQSTIIPAAEELPCQRHVNERTSFLDVLSRWLQANVGQYQE